MTIQTNVFSYLADRSGIPLWVFDENGDLVYSSIDAAKLKDAEAAGELLGNFCAGRSKTPNLQRLDENELFAGFDFIGGDADARGGGVLSLVIGPAYETHPFRKAVKTAVSVNFLLKHEYVKTELLKMPVVTVSEFCRYVSVLAAILNGERYGEEELRGGISERTLAKLLNRQLVELIFDMREDERPTVYAPEEERKLLSYVAKGDVEAVRNFRMPAVRDPNTQDTRYQALFEAVAMVTLATRAAIAGGVDYVVAFSLSDLYFKRLSQNVTDREIADIVSQVLLHFTQKVREISAEKDRGYSPYITQCVRYIRAHLHYPISLEEVAAELNINPKYLSRLFVACQGEKFSTFVQRERILEARNLLENTDRSIVEISHSLGFSSQSYFIKVFTRFVGMTPGQFLEQKKSGKG